MNTQSTQTPDELLAEYTALEKRLNGAGRASEVAFNALDKRIKAVGYKATPKSVEVPKAIMPVPDEPENNDCATICAAIKETEQNIIAAMKPDETEPPAPPPKPKWRFVHKYDRYNKLVETTAEAT